MGDHLSAKAEPQSRAGALADSAVLRSGVMKRTGPVRQKNFILAARFTRLSSARLVGKTTQRCDTSPRAV